MVGSGSAGVSKQSEDGNKLLRELEALSHALHRKLPVATPPGKDPVSRHRRASESHHSASKSFRKSHHSISAPTADIPGMKNPLPELRILEEKGISGGMKSLWDWKPLRALAHIGQHKFQCVFLAQVHAITGLPPSMNGLRLTVGFGHRDSHAHTLPCRISQQIAEFDENLSIRCSVYGSKKSSHRMKYMPKFFLLSVVATDVDEVDVGRFQLDLTQLLPVSFDSKDLNKTTSFELSGKAKGATLTVSFGYEILDKEFRHKSIADDGELGSFWMGRGLQALNSMPNSPQTSSIAQRSNTAEGRSSPQTSSIAQRSNTAEGRSSLLKHTFRPRSLSHSDTRFVDLSSLYSKMKKISGVDAFHLGNSAIQASKSRQQSRGVDPALEDDVDFEVVDRGVEISSLCVNASMPLPPTPEGEEEGFDSQEQPAKENPPPASLPSIEKSDGKAEALVREKVKDWKMHPKIPSTPTENLLQKENPKNLVRVGSMEKGTDTFQGFGEEKIKDPIDDKTLEPFLAADLQMQGGAGEPNLVDEADLVTGQFLHMLEEDEASEKHSCESESNSPKALLLKQFEQEALLEGGIGLDLCFSPNSRLSACSQKDFKGLIVMDTQLLPETRDNGFRV